MKKTGLGVQGENLALDYLKKKGYKILARNFISRFGEIDIIASNKSYLCFVEVKTRSPKFIAYGRESVTLSKQQKIIKTAEYYIVKNAYLVEKLKLQPRFDCIEIYVDNSGELTEINHYENAFS